MTNPRLSSLFAQAEHAHTQRALPAPPPSSKPRVWSQEQNEFLATQAPRLALSALAGTGKTSLLIEYARRRPHQIWNFVAFNVDVVKAVQARSPRNMRVHTAHHLAYAKFGHDLHHKLSDQVPSSQAWMSFLEHIPKAARVSYAKTLRAGLEAWCHSPSRTISHLLCPEHVWLAHTLAFGETSWSTTTWEDDLERIWRACLDPSHPLPISHDVYLKRFAMMDHVWPGSYWMLDEAQDWSEAFLSAWDANTTTSIRAGDPFQRLYEWRGASQGPWLRTNEQERWLTHSHRTGIGPEHLINARLSDLGSPHPWVPSNGACSVLTDPQTSKHMQHFGPDVVLATQWDTLDAIGRMLLSQGQSVRYPSGAPLGLPQAEQGMLLLTIHRAKGLEFDRVWIADQPLPATWPSWQKDRLAYVAMTRARHALRVPSQWQHSTSQNSTDLLFDDDDSAWA